MCVDVCNYSTPTLEKEVSLWAVWLVWEVVFYYLLTFPHMYNDKNVANLFDPAIVIQKPLHLSSFYVQRYIQLVGVLLS